jgi:hypothetical protein
MAGKEVKAMQKISILLIIGIAVLFLGCQKEDHSWFRSDDVGRYQVIHYTSATTPHTEFYLRVDTQTGWTELFYRDGGKIKYMDSFFIPEIEGKKDFRKN